MIILLSVALMLFTGSGMSQSVPPADCWETGCQPHSWAVVGCQQYKRREFSRRPCQGGTQFTCCTASGGYASNVISIPQPGFSGGDCWETGCQSNSWAIIGCQQYGRREISRRPCYEGYHFTCCSTRGVADNLVITTPELKPSGSQSGSPTADCWETGCQPNSWTVVGCQQYGRQETGRRPCPGGNHFTCCTTGGGNGNTGNPQVIQPGPPGAGCWETGCQSNSWAVVGCQQYDRKETSRRQCPGGHHFTCCTNDGGNINAVNQGTPSTTAPDYFGEGKIDFRHL